jgi:hypothetical protein
MKNKQTALKAPRKRADPDAARIAFTTNRVSIKT